MPRINFYFLIIGLFFASKSANGQTYKAYVNAGDHAMAQARYQEAVEYFRNALDFDNGEIETEYKMAEAYRLSKDYEKAAAWYSKVWGEDKSEFFPLALFRLAEMRKYLANYEESCRLFNAYATKHPEDTTYAGIKSRAESSTCIETMQLNEATPKATVRNAGSPVNSKFSDFGATQFSDSILYYSSLKFLFEPKEKKKTPYYVSRILKTQPNADKGKQPVALGVIINEPPLHNSSACFSPDRRMMVFSRCNQQESDGQMRCELYYSILSGGSWTKPTRISDQVNLKNYTSTQPALEARGADGYTLYFVSDRPGGFGKLDIWESDFDATFRFTEARNLGAVINTFDDEMTPFYDTPNKTLYFSSYGHAGLGGMDIFKSSHENQTFSKPENMGKAYNSSCNDVYFTKNLDSDRGTLTSNRPGSQFISSKTCCYDIYYHEPVIDLPVLDTIRTILPSADSLAKTDPTKKAYYDDFLPLSLYFDNDEPDKKTLAISTSKSYDRLYKDYMNRIDDYRKKYSDGLNKSEKGRAIAEIDSFFNGTVSASWNMLNAFCDKIEKAMKKGISVELEVRGRASPLAESTYNINLSRRRISSLVNYMQSYNAGVLKPYFDNGNLKVTEVPAGETLAKSGISDQLNDQRNSIYNPTAARERLIELIGVNLKQPDSSTPEKP